MKKKNYEAVEKKVYGKPMIRVVSLESADIICTSGNEATVSNPWGENTEEEW